MDSLTAQINNVLAQYTSDVDKTLDEVMSRNAKEAKQALTYNSPARTGKYAKSWAVKKRHHQRWSKDRPRSSSASYKTGRRNDNG